MWTAIFLLVAEAALKWVIKACNFNRLSGNWYKPLRKINQRLNFNPHPF